MELYLEPIFKTKRIGRYEKGHTPWNKGKSTGLVYSAQLDNLKLGNKARWAKHKGEPAWNSVPVSVYDLSGKYIKTFLSSRFASKELNLQERNIRKVMKGERRRVGDYQFKPAKIVEFQGQKLVKKENIDQYKRLSRYNKTKKIMEKDSD